MTIRFNELYGSVTLQSKANPGRRHFGVPVGGPFDLVSHSLANALLEQDRDCPTLELSGVTGRIEALDAGMISWVGAGAIQASRAMAKGEELALSCPANGCRSYLALSGGVIALNTGARTYCSVIDLSPKPKRVSEFEAKEQTLRIVPSSGFRTSLRELLDQRFLVDSRSNRVGIRLTAERPLFHATELPSEPTEVGVVQIPPSGHPIILGPDGPTIGGYPRVGYIAPADISNCAQLAPGDPVRFREITPEEAAASLVRAEVNLKLRVEVLRNS